MALEVRRDPDPAAFREEARRSLIRDEAAHGLLLSILDDIDRGRWPEVERTWVRPVAMAAAVGPTPGGIRISAVYTPPAERRRGYATALVAALGRAQLEVGRRFCLLDTDLANPTSNAVYRRIGYRPVRDDTHWAFAAAGAEE